MYGCGFSVHTHYTQTETQQTHTDRHTDTYTCTHTHIRRYSINFKSCKTGWRHFEELCMTTWRGDCVCLVCFHMHISSTTLTDMVWTTRMALAGALYTGGVSPANMYSEGRPPVGPAVEVGIWHVSDCVSVAIFNHQRHIPIRVAENVMAEAAAAALGESVCQCFVRVGIMKLVWYTYVSLLSYCQCLKCYELFLLPSSDRQELGRQLLEACRFGEWEKAISFVEKGEWTTTERHREVIFC